MTTTTTLQRISPPLHATHLRDELVVRTPHCHRPEEGLEIVGKLAAASVFFSGRVERNEDARVQIYVDFSTEEPYRRQTDDKARKKQKRQDPMKEAGVQKKGRSQ